MKHINARFRSPRILRRPERTTLDSFIIVGMAFLLFLIVTPMVHAQGYGRVIYDDEPEPEPTVRPYLIGSVGVGDPDDGAYKEVFSDAYFRIGGGFGMRFGNLGAEVLLRQGSVSESHVVPISSSEEEYRTFSYGTTEAQLRLFGCAKIGSLRFPAGLGIGLVNITVDRGFPGVYDRFGSGNIFISPFAGLEIELSSSFSVGVEAEYVVSSVNFKRNDAWVEQYGGAPHGQIDRGYSFWDTVGGEQENKFESGGLVVSLRAIFYIPTYRGQD